MSSATTSLDVARYVGPLLSSKVQLNHQERLAIVYVRQSSTKQVEENIESTQLQYRLVDRAAAMGWSKERIEVIDDDLGMSGRSIEGRIGFQRLLAEVLMDHVGIVLGIEMSRLARSCRDWHQLLENCAIFGTLLGDADGVYDPRDHNDRLLLGLKGTMSEAELHILQGRLRAGQLNKARRGEYFTHAPIGYVRSENTLEKDPDDQVRDVVTMIFDKFIEIGSLSGVMKYFHDDKLSVPVRDHRGSSKGQLQWRRPNQATLLCMLHHPIYAGAYVYGRRKTDPKKTVPGKPGRGRFWAPRDRWDVFIENKLPAYISKQQFEENQQKLWNNSSKYRAGSAMRGTSMLAGRVVCGRCGCHMSVSYSNKSNARFTCDMSRNQWGNEQCQALNARPLRELVSSLVLEAIAPASLELSLRAVEKLQQDRQTIEHHHQQTIDRAAYQSDLAQRRYESVDPSNRLVAAELERRWEAALIENRKAEEELARFGKQQPTKLSSSQENLIRTLSDDIPELWNAETTSGLDRQSIVRALVEQVVVEVIGQSERVRVTIRWSGGYESHHEIIKSVGKFERLESSTEIRRELIEMKRQGKTHQQVADALNASDYRSTLGGQYTGPIISGLCKKFRAEGVQLDESKDGPRWTLHSLAKELGLNKATLSTWRRRDWVHATKESERWTLWADDEDLKRLRDLVEYKRKRLSKTPASLTTPKTKPSITTP